MAVAGPLLESVRDLFEELGAHIRDLPQFPLPVRVREDDRCFGPLVNVLVALDEESLDRRDVVVGTLMDRGLREISGRGPTLRGSVPLDRIRALVDTDTDAVIEAASIVHPSLDHSVPEAWNGSGPPPGGPTGAGVIVGIVDTGIDLTHPSFRHPNGETRVLSFWDQSEDSTGATRPSEFAYGSERSKAEVDSLLRAPDGVPRDWAHLGGHGTAVAGVAAGNGHGVPSSRYLGLAPDADLIVVAFDARRSYWADTNNVADAIEYVFRRAEELGRRAVVNLSHGAQMGPHQASGSFEKEVTGILADDPARILVVSAGNTGDAGAHARLFPEQGEVVELPLIVPDRVGPYVRADAWYRLGSRLAIEVVDPGGNICPLVEQGRKEQRRIGDALLTLSWTPNDRQARDNRVQIGLHPTQYRGDVSNGRWALRFHGVSISEPAPLDIWLERGLERSPSFEVPFADADCTITSPAAANDVLTVGSYGMDPLGELSSFSSRGPDRIGGGLEMIAAPGAPVVSASSTLRGASHFSPGRGTSLAAAHVTGAIALMLERSPGASRDDVIECLRRTARSDGQTRAGPASAWGAGKLDVSAALEGI